MRYILTFVLLSFLLLTNASCNRNKELFTLLSHRKTGIEFKNLMKESPDFNVLKYGYLYNGAGVAVGDINNDGLPDIYFSGNLVSSRLYLNKGNFEFEDITEKAGVGAKKYWNNGVNMVDINGDSYLDIYVCNSTDGRPKYRKNLLFINNGDLTFTESAKQYGLDDDAYSTHSAFFDYDKDGDLDMFSLNHSLDVYAVFNKKTYKLKNDHDPKYQQKFFINTGSKFVDATKKVGLNSNVLNFGLGIAIADFNNDKWPDMYVCNDYFEQDYLYINNQDGTFSEQLENFFSHVSLSSMGSDASDFNNDGYIDLLSLEMMPEDNYEQKLVAGPDNYVKFSLLEKTGFYHQIMRNMLQVNNHGKYFTEIGTYAGVFSTNWSWSALWCDYDNDGYKDLFISNGYGRNNTHMDIIVRAVEEVLKQREGQKAMTQYDLVEKIPPTILKNYMFRNNRDLTFTNVTDAWGFEEPTLSNGTAYADLDNDGDMDLIINNINDYAYVYKNNSEKLTDNHFLKIKFKGSGQNIMGIGARVDIKCGDQQFTQEFMPSRGYMSSMNYELIFGLGQNTHIDELKVVWPDLRIEILRNLQVDQTITLINNNAHHIPETPPEPIDSIFKPLNNKKIIDFTHVENDYNDFKKQPLLPKLLSTQGPKAATGDVNGDGLKDIFIGGAKEHPGMLFIQTQKGEFIPTFNPWFDHDKGSEDIGALFFDADGDKDLDLYVVSGGNEFTITSPQLQDRLYMNDGNAHFTKAKNNLPKMLTSGSCVKSADFDQDGDNDLFIGGRLTPGLYPIAPRSYVLQNNGLGQFEDVTRFVNDTLMNPGMVTDAVWTDFNCDNQPDLILVGEWMPIRFFKNTGGKFAEVSKATNLKNTNGWWNTIYSADFDMDGDPDYILGNHGLNSQIKASHEHPVTLYARDFDKNGSLDPIMCYYILGESYPFYSRDDLASQIPGINDQYPDYKSYADQKITDIFEKSELDEALYLHADIFSSCYLNNLGNNTFTIKPLPAAAQFSPVYTVKSGDFNQDGLPDVVLAGNFFGTRVKFGRYDANNGLLLIGDGHGNFSEIPNYVSGLFVKGEVRDITNIKTKTGTDLLFFIINNGKVQPYKLLNNQH